MSTPTTTQTSNLKHGIIVADIGGTNSRAQYFNCHTEVDPIENIEIKTSMCESLEQFLKLFIDGLGKGLNVSNVDVVICIASMVVDNVAWTSANFDWPLSEGNEIMKSFGFKSVTLFNDFKACGYGIQGLTSHDIIPLGSSPPFKFNSGSEDSKYMLVGPGTGLGVCTILIKNGQSLVLSSEGAHINLPQVDARTEKLVKYIKETTKVEGFLSAEQVFCGRGLPYIYRFIMIEKGRENDIEEICGKEIVRRAVEEADPIGIEVVEFFMHIFGTTLCSLSAAILPRTGIILCQNIVFSTKDIIYKDCQKKDSIFMNALQSNPSIATFLEKIPIYICTKYNLGIFGCLQYAKMRLDS